MARRKRRRRPGSGYIRPLPNGRAQAHYPKPGGGYLVKRCDTPAAAEAWLAELGKQAAEELNIPGGQQTLDRWLNKWLALIESDDDAPIKARTEADYHFKLRYVMDLIGDARLADLTTDQVDAALRTIRKALAATTAHQIRNLLWRALDEATARGYIRRNPVPRPRRRRRAKGPNDRQVTRLDAAQARALLTAARSFYAPAWWLILCLGLRAGEVLGLRRCDLDLAAGTVTVAQQVTDLRGKPTITTPKTETSCRVLPLPRAIARMLAAHLDALTTRAARGVRAGTWQEHSLIFPGRSGKPMNPTSLRHMLKDLTDAAGLPAATVHHLRHTAAGLLRRAGADDALIGAILGHAPSTITGHYARPDLETLRPWVERVAALLASTADEQTA